MYTNWIYSKKIEKYQFQNTQCQCQLAFKDLSNNILILILYLKTKFQARPKFGKNNLYFFIAIFSWRSLTSTGSVALGKFFSLEKMRISPYHLCLSALKFWNIILQDLISVEKSIVFSMNILFQRWVKFVFVGNQFSFKYVQEFSKRF